MGVHMPSHVCQALLSMAFPRQEYWSVLPFPSPGYLPDRGINPIFVSFSSYYELLLINSLQIILDFIFQTQISTKIFQYYYYYSYHSMYSFLILPPHSFIHSFILFLFWLENSSIFNLLTGSFSLTHGMHLSLMILILLFLPNICFLVSICIISTLVWLC